MMRTIPPKNTPFFEEEKEDNWGGCVPNPPQDCPGRIIKGKTKNWVDVNWCNMYCDRTKYCVAKTQYHQDCKEARKRSRECTPTS